MLLGYKHSNSSYILLLISNWLWQPHVFTNHSHTRPLAQQLPGAPASNISMRLFGRITCCCPNTYTHPHCPLKVCVNSNLLSFPFFFFFNLQRLRIFLFIYFWLCWVFVSVRGLSLVAASGGHSSSRCAGVSLSWPLLLRSTGSRRAGSVVVAHGPSCSTACGIFPDQGSNPCPLHWQADSQPLRHQGSPHFLFPAWVLWDTEPCLIRTTSQPSFLIGFMCPSHRITPSCMLLSGFELQKQTKKYQKYNYNWFERERNY